MAFNSKNADSSVNNSARNRRVKISAEIVEAKPQEMESNIASIEEVNKIVADSSADLSGLLRDPEEINKIELSNPLALADHEEMARSKALKIMNTIRTLGPAISRALAHSDKDDEQAQHLITMTDLTQKMAKETAEVMGVNHTYAGNRWMLNVLERTYMEALPDDMLQEGSIGVKMVKAIYQVASEREQEKSDRDIKEIPMTLSVQLALIKAMSPILREQNKFDFFRNRDADLERISNMIMNSASEALKESLDALTKEEDRVVAYKVFVEEAGKSFADCWKMEAEKVNEALSSKSVVEVEALLESRPDGLSIDKIITNFENQFRRLKSLANLPKSPK